MISSTQGCRFVFSAAVAFIALTSAREAAADPLGVEIAARAGIGLYSEGPPAFGLGLRAGASIESLYFGATVIDYFGQAHTVQPPNGGLANQTGAVTETIQRLLYGVGFGYDFKPLTWLRIRPEIGAGFASVSGTCSSPSCAVETTTSPYIEPGVTGLFGLGTHVFVGADAGLVIVPVSGGGFLVALDAQAGVRF